MRFVGAIGDRDDRRGAERDCDDGLREHRDARRASFFARGVGRVSGNDQRGRDLAKGATQVADRGDSIVRSQAQTAQSDSAVHRHRGEHRRCVVTRRLDIPTGRTTCTSHRRPPDRRRRWQSGGPRSTLGKRHRCPARSVGSFDAAARARHGVVTETAIRALTSKQPPASDPESAQAAIASPRPSATAVSPRGAADLHNCRKSGCSRRRRCRCRYRSHRCAPFRRDDRRRARRRRRVAQRVGDELRRIRSSGIVGMLHNGTTQNKAAGGCLWRESPPLAKSGPSETSPRPAPARRRVGQSVTARTTFRALRRTSGCRSQWLARSRVRADSAAEKAHRM